MTLQANDLDLVGAKNFLMTARLTPGYVTLSAWCRPLLTLRGASFMTSAMQASGQALRAPAVHQPLLFAAMATIAPE